MSMKIKEMIDTLISIKSENNPILAKIIRAKLILNGIDPNKLAMEEIDDPLVIAKLEKLVKDL